MDQDRRRARGDEVMSRVAAGAKKNDAIRHPKVLNHIGLLFNGPPSAPGLPFV